MDNFYSVGIGYAGSKCRTAGDIVAQLPGATMLVDVFGGSSALSIAALRSNKYKAVIYNDINLRLVRMLRTIRDQPNAVAERMALTPVCKDEVDWSIRHLDDADDVVAAVAALFLCHYSSKYLPDETGGFWRPIPRQRNAVRSGAALWHNNPPRLRLLALELARLDFANQHWKKLVSTNEKMTETQRRLGGCVVFLCDPPYKASGGIYGIQDFDHDEFLLWARKTKSPVALLDRQIEDLALVDWRAVKIKAKTGRSQNKDERARADMLYLNPAAVALKETARREEIIV